MSLLLRPIQAGDQVNGFSLGASAHQPLKTFLKRDALKYHRKNVAKTFVLIESEEDTRVLGYLTLLCSEIKNEAQTELADCKTANRYETFPAIKLARLAVDRRYQGQGYGRGMMAWCIGHIAENIMPHTGCRFLVADVKPDALEYYEKLGFTLLKTTATSKHPVVYIDLNKLVGEPDTT